MNALSLLTIFFGLITIGLYCVVCVLFDRNEQLRQTIGTVPLVTGDLGLLTVGPEGDSASTVSCQQSRMALVEECQLLEQRNDWLEWRMMHCQNVVALSMAQSRLPRRDRMRMEVAEMEGMP